MKPHLAKYWFTAARAGYAQKNDWQSWADKHILSMPIAPPWLLQVSLAQDLEGLKKALYEATKKEWAIPFESSDDAIIGYLWWRHSLGQLSLHESLTLAGEAADAGDSKLHCEDIYHLLNELEAGEKPAHIEARAEELIGPLQEVAKKQWETIQKACDS
jgi:hypothetical protein